MAKYLLQPSYTSDAFLDPSCSITARAEHFKSRKKAERRPHSLAHVHAEVQKSTNSVIIFLESCENVNQHSIFMNLAIQLGFKKCIESCSEKGGSFSKSVLICLERPWPFPCRLHGYITITQRCLHKRVCMAMGIYK